jgi:Uma2 family endonuclease
MKTGPDLQGRSPDVFFVAKANLSRVQRKDLQGPADLVIEVISPGSRRLDRGDKFQEYERGCVPEYWPIDPERKTAEFYQLKNGVFEEQSADENGIYRSSSLPDFWLNMEWLTHRPLPSTIRVLRELHVI